jgi:hypothetical protein
MSTEGGSVGSVFSKFMNLRPSIENVFASVSPASAKQFQYAGCRRVLESEGSVNLYLS